MTRLIPRHSFGKSHSATATNSASAARRISGCVQREPDDRERGEVLGERSGPVAEGLRRSVDRRPPAGLGEVRAGGDGSAQQARGEREPGIVGADGVGSQQRARRHAHEGVHRVPQRVEAGDLVDEELDGEERARDRHYHRMAQHLEARGQRRRSNVVDYSEKKQHRVEPHAARPAQARHERDGGNDVHRDMLGRLALPVNDGKRDR